MTMANTRKEKAQVQKGRTMILLDLTKELDGESFSSFKKMRIEANKVITGHRENFIEVVLRRKGVPYKASMTKREKAGLFERCIIGVVKDNDKNYDRVYVEGSMVAYWSNDYKIEFKGGRMICKLYFKMF